MLACVFASDGVYAGAGPAIGPGADQPAGDQRSARGGAHVQRERERGSAGQRIRQRAAERDVSDRLRQRAECDGAEEGARADARQAGA